MRECLVAPSTRQENEPQKLITNIQRINEPFLREYAFFLANKAEGTIDAYVRTTRHVMEWIAQRPGNDGRFHPRQLTKTAVEVYLASLEQEGFSLNHRALVKSTISSFARWLMEEKGLLRESFRCCTRCASHTLNCTQARTSQLIYQNII